MKRSMACSCLLALCATLWSQGAGAQGMIESKAVASEAQSFELGVGKSKVLDLTTSIKRASLANPEVADTVVLSPKQIYLTGKAIGVTTLTLWKENGELFSAFDITVSPDLSQLREQLHKILPDEPGILVTAHARSYQPVRNDQQPGSSVTGAGNRRTLCAEEGGELAPSRGSPASHARGACRRNGPEPHSSNRHQHGRSSRSREQFWIHGSRQSSPQLAGSGTTG